MARRANSRFNLMMLAFFVLLTIPAQAREFGRGVSGEGGGGGSCRYVGICETESDCAHSCYAVPHKATRCDPDVGGRGPQCCCLQ
ncbi:hypothetical protein V2J09_019459 [Rumex salicifolius]